MPFVLLMNNVIENVTFIKIFMIIHESKLKSAYP